MKKLSFNLFFVIVSFASGAQALVTNESAIISIQNNVPMTIQGNFTNSGTISNEGAMRLYGDWTNGGNYLSVSGTFSLLGESQIVDPGTSAYSNIRIVNGGTAVLSDLHVSESFELTSGIVSFMPDTRLLLDENTEVIGGNESSYIDGAMFATGSGNLFFPIGTSAEYLPITLSDVQISDSVGVQAFSVPLSIANTTNLDEFSQSRYWRIFGNDGFTASSIELPLANVTFIESSDEAVVAFASNLDMALQAIGSTTLSGSLESGSISAAGAIRAGYYVIADEGSEDPPITVINLVTSLQDGKHDFLRIENIEFYKNNLVEVFDRNGVKVFEMTGYDNQDKVFRGSANVGSRGELATGNYYFTIKLTGSKRESGFIYVKN